MHPYTYTRTYKLEGVHRCATRMVLKLEGLDCENKLKILQLSSLETRRGGANLIMTYKVLKSLRNLGKDKNFKAGLEDYGGLSGNIKRKQLWWM